MASKLYGKITRAEVIAPEGDEFERVQQCYVDMASIGHVNDEQRRTFFEAGRRLSNRGAEAVLLGGTDLFLAFTGRDCGFPVIDCADVHVGAIYQKSST
jgi:aspartate racemase